MIPLAGNYFLEIFMAQPILDEKTIYLIDGSGYIFRAFFAIRSLHSRAGVPTNAVFGFTNMLMKLLKEHKPKYLAIAFDRKEPTFRHKLYQDYKANRPEPPEDLVPQFALIHRLVEAFNIKLLSMSGFEADDLIGTMTKRAQLEGREVVIVTGDKDFMQLVNGKIFLLDELRAARSGAEQFIDADQVKKELGIEPERVVDLLALAGDTSDNVPGVSGIGKKTAAELINEFGPLEQILAMAPLIKQKSRREKLIDGHNLALLSKKLVAIDCDAPIDCSVEDLRYHGIDQEKAHALFLELDFNRLLHDQHLFKNTEQAIGQHKSKDLDVDRDKYFAVIKKKQFEDLYQTLLLKKKIAIDTQTDGLDSTTARLIGIALSWGKNESAYIPVAHTNAEEEQINLALVKERIGSLLSDKRKCIVAHNAKFDHKVLARYGFGEFTIGGDPMLANYLLHQDQERHSLSDLSLKYLQHQPITFEEVCGVKKGQITFGEVSVEAATKYAAEEADLALRLEEKLLGEVKASQLIKLYQDLELPLEEVLSRMERVGVRLDITVLKEIEQELKGRLLDLKAKAHEIAGVSFNLASPKQIAEVLFEKLSLPRLKKIKTGSSTDSFVLEKLVKHHPIAKILLEHRMCAKLINTYIDTLPLLINQETGRLHTTYNQFVTATGRLSSSDPNLQNIPIRTREGRRIRQAFVARAGYRLISLDYSQVELRLLAFVSRDPVLLDSFALDQDVHRRTASEIFEIDPEQVTKQQRDAAKTINFGLLYGMGAHRLSQTLNIERKQAQNYLDKYFAKYAGILRWKNDALLEARQTREVRTLFGRRRSLPELLSRNTMEQARGERIAINTPIQGSAADIIKKAMIDTDHYLRAQGFDAHLIMQVHDELVIEAPLVHAEQIAVEVARIMSHGHGLDLELKVDYGIADNWDAAH